MKSGLFLAVVFASVVGCSGKSSSPSVVVNNQNTQGTAAAAKADASADKLKAFATKTPPAGGKSAGKMSQPKIGAVIVPITDVEVYTFEANVDGDAEDETLYWAANGEEVYVWGKIALECVDDDGKATGEVGDADFVYAATDTSYGWMTATDSCGYTTHFGCTGGASGETCGGCDFDSAMIVCAAATSDN